MGKAMCEYLHVATRASACLSACVFGTSMQTSTCLYVQIAQNN